MVIDLGIYIWDIVLWVINKACAAWTNRQIVQTCDKWSEGLGLRAGRGKPGLLGSKVRGIREN